MFSCDGYSLFYAVNIHFMLSTYIFIHFYLTSNYVKYRLEANYSGHSTRRYYFLSYEMYLHVITPRQDSVKGQKLSVF